MTFKPSFAVLFVGVVSCCVGGFVHQGRPPLLALRPKSSAIGVYSSSPEEDNIDSPEYEFDRERIEFMLDDEDVQTVKYPNQDRRQNTYMSGDDLVDLRKGIADLREELRDAKMHLTSIQGYFTTEEVEVKQTIRNLENDISAACLLDPEFSYVFNSEISKSAERRGDVQAAAEAKRDAQDARRCIPQLNMHGIWVGE